MPSKNSRITETDRENLLTRQMQALIAKASEYGYFITIVQQGRPPKMVGTLRHKRDVPQ